MAERYDWIVLKYNVTPNLMLCERCKKTYPIHMPCSIGMAVAMNNQFIKEHKNCSETLVEVEA